MGKRGPAKTPTAILEARGSWRADRRTDEPHPEAEMPECPVWLKGEARKKWFELAPQLYRMGVLTKLDGDILAQYCTTYVLWLKELSYETKDDCAISRYQGWLYKLGRELGMTPASRAGLSVKPPPESDKKSKFFKG